MKPKSKIKLVLVRPNGHRSEVEISGMPVSNQMLDAAEDLLETMTTGKRPKQGGK